MMKRAIMLLLLLIPLAQASLQSDIQNASDEVIMFFDDVPRYDVAIVQGSISLEEKMLVNMLKGQIDDAQGMTVYNDDRLPDKHLILLGSERTNDVSRSIQLTEKEEKAYPPMNLVFGKDGDRLVLIVHSLRELANNANMAAQRSPLSNVMPVAYVPAAAALLSLLLMYLWTVLQNTGMELGNEWLSSRLLSKKEEEHIKRGELINRQEVFAFVFSTLVFSLTMSWTWFSDDFWSMFVLNLAVVAIVTFFREGIRLILCYRHNIRSEYEIWGLGTVLTLLSTYLGNTFSLVGYTKVEHEDEKIFGRVSFVLSLASLLTAGILYILNIFMPSLLVQMLFVYVIMMTFIEMFPREPMPGNDMKEWNSTAWALLYVFVFIAYVAMNFTAYV